ncbi:MAG: hypothetical protein KJP16_12920 [Gammaproteobacteria bacterium]|nr:hypothetical protein [Gammaproteobacteria bacterium]NNL51708.1 hypothetical protein [Woeseiaceae bacterium]
MKDHRLIVDGHVHFYEPGHVQTALSAASANFRSTARSSGIGVDYGLLMLADPGASPGFKWATRLPYADSPEDLSDKWQVVSNPDDSVLHVAKVGALPIAILAGRQVISSENLEVLIFPPGGIGKEMLPVTELVGQAAQRRALVIIPWGVGKWFGKRGQIVSSILSDSVDGQVLVGDNGGRPRIWNRVRLLEDARARGIPNIAGTDPLPVPGEERRVGTFGVSVSAAVSHEWTTEDFLTVLRKEISVPFGRQMSATGFIRKQLALRIKKRSANTASTAD